MTGQESRTDPIGLVLWSFLILHFELVFIRFLPANVQALAFFTNLVILATFLGMGAGLILAERRPSLPEAFPLLLLATALATKVLAAKRIGYTPTGEFLWTIPLAPSSDPHVYPIELVVLSLFVLLALLFVPLGYRMGRAFAGIPTLHAYSLNVAGSLAGILLFTVFGWLGLSPWAWFLAGALVFLVASLRQARPAALAFHAACLAGTLLAVQSLRITGGERWSPYYRINLAPVVGMPMTTLLVNHSLHQYMVDLSDAGAAQSQVVADIRSHYRAAYDGIERRDDVLILGAGTGNDVQIAIGQGAGHIDAVEIDPVILAIGKAQHPNHPYQDPRVTTYVNDARAYLRRCEKRYDVIVTGTLDSQTLLSGMTSVRLDNYMYTKEAFDDLVRHLKPGGTLVTYHMTPHADVAEKIFHLFTSAFRAEPSVRLFAPHYLFNYIFRCRKPADAEAREIALPWRQKLPLDDWPYLYLRMPTIPAHYRGVMAGILVAALAFVLAATGGRDLRQADFALFFLGSGFLLLETSSVTRMSLLFGSTWIVSSMVFTSVLAVILIANAIVIARGAIRPGGIFAALAAAIALGYTVTPTSLLSFPAAVQWLAGVVLVGAPVFFAALLFAQLFRTRARPATALAYNTLGAIVGGLFEYGSMVVGMRDLYLVALVFYLLALLAHGRRPSA
ncbi:MAG: hypothetical protein U0166_08845 [Acidobacteriota bacterium]